MKLFPFIILFSIISFSQSNLKISFKPYNLNSPYQFNTTVSDLAGTPFKLTTLYYYISNIHVYHDGGQHLNLSDTVLIVKNDNYTFDFGNQSITTIEQINFGVGVPLSLNHSDISTYPIDHPLSFHSPSMQWGWTSGYNQIGIVGQGDVNIDWITENDFELFSLGDDLYKNVQLPISSTSSNSQVKIDIRTNIEQLLRNINPATVGFVHSGTGANVTMMENIINYPVFTQGDFTSILENKMNEGELYSSIQSNEIKVNWTNFMNASSYKLLNIEGKEIAAGNIDSNKGEVIFTEISNGNYWFVIFSKDGNQLNRIRIIK